MKTANVKICFVDTFSKVNKKEVEKKGKKKQRHRRVELRIDEKRRI